MTIRDVLIEFIAEENYRQFWGMFRDGRDYPAEYSAYLERLTYRENTIRLAGHRPQRVEVSPANFLSWCQRAKRKWGEPSLTLYLDIKWSTGRDP